MRYGRGQDADGWGHLTAVIDCHDREIVNFEFALHGRAKEAERAIEEACLARFGTLRPDCATPVVLSDNGLIFQSRRFRAALSRLSASAVVHHLVHARTKYCRTVLPQSRRGMCLNPNSWLDSNGALQERINTWESSMAG
jgi:transposase InsO family protein